MPSRTTTRSIFFQNSIDIKDFLLLLDRSLELLKGTEEGYAQKTYLPPEFA
ncbi:hypothetical protein C5167_004168 [Papaver somniferum]|nr:hypothetical protein C5167_004168 [Papaver somniferum]